MAIVFLKNAKVCKVHLFEIPDTKHLFPLLLAVVPDNRMRFVLLSRYFSYMFLGTKDSFFFHCLR